jgi:hypothetical protein
MTQPDRSDWQIGGNLNIDDSTQFIGTLDGNDLVFKTDGLERARLKANGDFYINRIFSNRIISEDSVIALGPNSFHFNQGTNNISISPGTPWWNTSLTFYGLGIGEQSFGFGLNSIALGTENRCNNENAIAIGSHVRSNGDNAIIIGSGFSNGASNFVNAIDNSIMMGMNSLQPTLFLAPGGDPNQNHSGAVGINTTNIPAGFKLAVKGKIIAEEVLVKTHPNPPWGPDYVFQPDYRLMPLDELSQYVNAFCHLPEVPSADDMMLQGVAVHEMQLLLLKKVEELTLYILKQQQEIDALRKKVDVEVSHK